MRMVRSFGPALAVVAALVLGACGDGEDRPGQVTSEGSGSGTGSASGTGSSGSASGTGAGGHDHGGGGAAFSESEADSEAHVTLTDYAIAMPNTVKGTKVFFEAANNGAADHEFLVVDDHGDEVGGIEPFKKADGEKTVGLELAPGSYKAVCLVKEGPKTHQQLGMEASFTVE